MWSDLRSAGLAAPEPEGITAGRAKVGYLPMVQPQHRLSQGSKAL